MRDWIYYFSFLLLLFQSCAAPDSKQASTKDYLKFSGPTMGTVYTITCGPTQDTSLKSKVDELLVALNDELSTYIPSSTISQFNSTNQPINLAKYPYMKANLQASREIFKATEGYFDPTVMPLVNYWGFGYTEKKAVEEIDTAKILALNALVGFDKINWSNGNLTKENEKSQLDFSAIAKGYAVDEIGRLLLAEGVSNFLIDIGGELVAKGKNAQGNIWQVGVNMPKKEARLQEIVLSLPLENKGMATSGNYRNYYEVNGRVYGHTLNPKTGFPESEILSATVIANTCMMADGYATAFMAMGLEKSMTLAENTNGLEAIFLFTDEEGKLAEASTKNIKQLIKHQ